MRFVKILYNIVRDPLILSPDIKRKSVRGLDYHALKALGIRYIIFDKDNTLTKTYNGEFYDQDVEESFQKGVEVFGVKNVGILSNSMEKDRKDWKGVGIITSKKKKPFNFDDAKSHFGAENNEEIAVVGDRLMTDIMMANLKGALGVYVEPLERSHEKINIKMMRLLEDYTLKFVIKGKRRKKALMRKI